MASRARPGLVAIAVAAILAATSTTAFAGGRLVVKFDGPDAKTFRKQVKEIIKKADYRVVRTSSFEKVAKQMGAAKETTANVKRVAAKKHLEGIIYGEIDKRGGTYLITVRVRYGKTGEETARVRLKSRSTDLSGSDMDKLREAILPALRGESTIGGGDSQPEVKGDDDDDDDHQNDAKGDDDDDHQPDAKGDDDDDDHQADVKSGDDDDDDDDGGGSLLEKQRLPWLEAAVGLGFNRRVFNYQVAGDLGADRPVDFSNGLAPAISLGVEAYPLDRDAKSSGFTSKLGVRLAIERVVFFSSVIKSDMGDTKLGTTHQQISLDAIYRQTLLSDKLVLKPKVGFVLAQFKIDEGNSIVNLPDVNYQGVDLALGGNYTLNQKMAVGLNGGYLLLLKVGQIDNADQYGEGSKTGYHFGGSFDYRLSDKLLARGGAEAVLISHSFDGNGELNDVNNDAMSDITGASDINVWFYARAIYELR